MIIQFVIYFGIILGVWLVTWALNQRYDDDPGKDFFRMFGAILLTIGILFFWHWI